MLVQVGLCRTCSETTLLVFPRGGSNIVLIHPVLIVCVKKKLKCFSIDNTGTCEDSEASEPGVEGVPGDFSLSALLL